MLKKIQYNAPAILTFALLSLAVLGLGEITHGWSDRALFSTYRSSLINPLTYVRAFGHVLGHDGWNHYASNMIYILLLGPLLEEKYGTRNIVEMIVLTAVVTAIFNAVFFPHVRLLGASGIVYMMIILSSQVNVQEGRIPLTMIFACIVYIGGEVTSGLFTHDNIAHFAHIIGGVCGGLFGFVLTRDSKKKA